MAAQDTTAIVAVGGQEMERPRTGSMMLLRPIARVEEIISSHQELAQVIGRALTDGQDYGVVPGTRGRDGKPPKKVLFKPGAERILIAFGAFAAYHIVEREADHDRVIEYTKEVKDWNNRRPGGGPTVTEEHGSTLGLYRYVVKANVTLRATGEIIGDGIGVCSSLETKYIDRPRDLENTILKMAQKRALVAAVLNTFALSDRFTQDLEDSLPEASPVAVKIREGKANNAAPSPASHASPPDTTDTRSLVAHEEKELKGTMTDADWDGKRIYEAFKTVTAKEPAERLPQIRALREKYFPVSAVSVEWGSAGVEVDEFGEPPAGLLDGDGA